MFGSLTRGQRWALRTLLARGNDNLAFRHVAVDIADPEVWEDTAELLRGLDERLYS
jgi:hypothetical protein